MRIGEVAALTGTTPRTIRYYEEIGLLSCGMPRQSGQHRAYTEADVERINEIVRLKELLGLSLGQVTRSDGQLDAQLKLVRGRIADLTMLEAWLCERAGQDARPGA